MRFVEWFTGRGELYEHNLRVIDKHLGQLSEAAYPATGTPHLPYDSHIRHQPPLKTHYNQMDKTLRPGGLDDYSNSDGVVSVDLSHGTEALVMDDPSYVYWS